MLWHARCIRTSPADARYLECIIPCDQPGSSSASSMLDGIMESCWLEPGAGADAVEPGSGADLGVELSSRACSVELGSGADPARQIIISIHVQYYYQR